VITAVDTSVLLDVFGADPTFGSRSREAVRSCLAEGSLVACEVVWAEITGWFEAPADSRQALDGLGVGFRPIDQGTALGAGEAWGAYRKKGGRRTRMIADFLIGAHALSHADRLLTRDRGFYRTYFSSLAILDPATG
jgi:hypothetical protein